jgi:N-acyl homoserine lactone hydrolase
MNKTKKLLLPLLLTAIILVYSVICAGSAAPVQIKVYAFTCGLLKTKTQYTFPVLFFLIKHENFIEHEESWVAFDTGNNAMAAKDAVGYWGKAIVDIYTPIMNKEDEFKIQIKKLGITPKDIKCVILSHGHLDHAGAIDNFRGTDVPIYLQKKELEAINNAVASGQKSGYTPDDFKYIKELNIKTIEGNFDVFGDETVVAFQTPGHTPGHQSLLVKLSNGKSLIFPADAIYQVDATSQIFKIMQIIGAEIVPTHDPKYWKDKPMAPDAAF